MMMIDSTMTNHYEMYYKYVERTSQNKKNINASSGAQVFLSLANYI